MRRSDRSDILLRQLPVSWRGAAIAGSLMILVGFGGFATWAGVAPLDSAAIAPGYVTVDSSRKKVQHLEGGIVQQIFVQDGDRITKGQVLIRLDATRARASLGITQTAWDAAKAQEARLIAEWDHREELLFPASLLSRSGEPKVAEALATQRSLFEARRTSLEGETSLLEQKIGQLGEEIDGLMAQKRALEKQAAFVSDELRGLRQLWKDGLVEKSRVLALEREAARLEGERGRRISDIARTKTAIGEAKLQIIQLRKSFHEKVVTEIRDVQTKLSDLEERLTAARHVLRHIDIVAPVDGIVVGLDVHTIGGVIKAGDTVLEVVPVRDSLLVEARLQPSDIDNTHVGQSADVHFTSLNRRTAPALSGEVAHISADRLVDEKTGEPYYRLRVTVSETEVARLGEHELVPGMPAEVIVKTGVRTAARYLLQPLLDGLRHAWREE